MTAFVFQNEPRCALGRGGTALGSCCAPVKGGHLALASHPQTGCPGVEGEASGLSSLVRQTEGQQPPARTGSSSFILPFIGHDNICLPGPPRAYVAHSMGEEGGSATLPKQRTPTPVPLQGQGAACLLNSGGRAGRQSLRPLHMMLAEGTSPQTISSS